MPTAVYDPTFHSIYKTGVPGSYIYIYIYLHSHYSIFHPERTRSSLPALAGSERQPNEDSGILSLTGADKIHSIVCVSELTTQEDTGCSQQKHPKMPKQRSGTEGQ